MNYLHEVPIVGNRKCSFVLQREQAYTESGGKLALYTEIKLFPEIEPYCRASLSVGVRRVLARLWTGCLPLQIELGCYTSPKTLLNMRICKLCNDGTEDQEHLLFHCRALTNY